MFQDIHHRMVDINGQGSMYAISHTGAFQMDQGVLLPILNFLVSQEE